MKNLKLKPVVYGIMIMTLVTTAFAQNEGSISRKQITVTGSAEMSITPDEVELAITIYDKRSEFEKRENNLAMICKKHGVPEDQLSFKSAFSSTWGDYWYYWSYWWYYRYSSDITQTYKIKVNNKVNMLDLVKDLNQPWVRNITINSTSNKDMTTYRKEVKKEAMRMAKEKATYLLEAIGEKIGSVIMVEEVIADNKQSKDNPYGHGYYHPYYGWDYYGGYYGGYNGGGSNNSMSNSSMNSNSVMSSNGGGSGNSGNSEEAKIEGLSKIRLRYEVKAVFEIQ